jgi:CIC family chloride channel protein
MSERLWDRARAPVARTLRPWLDGGQSPLWHALLAVVVGAIAGVGALVFRWLIAIVHNGLFYGVFSITYDANRHSAASPWGAAIILAPVVGALVVAFLVQHFAPEAKGHGVPEVMDAIYYKRGIIRPAVAAVKALASAISIGSGASGGVFSPSLFIGATLGASYAGLVNYLAPAMQLAPSGTAVIGMAGVVGGATGAVVTAIVMIFEMTRDYHVIIPLMIAVSIAYGIRRIYMESSIYDLKLIRRGHYIPNALQTNLYLMMSLSITRLIRSPRRASD